MILGLGRAGLSGDECLLWRSVKKDDTMLY
jgi:hypothetical protein